MTEFAAAATPSGKSQVIRDLLIWQTARDRLPLPMLMTEMGDCAFTVKGAPCPFCLDNKKKWGLFKQDNGHHYFKCHKPGCAANDPVHGHSEIGYIALRRGIDGKAASKECLRMAVPELVVPEDDIPDLKRDETTPTNVWHGLWKKLPLTAADHKKLMEDRGFNDATVHKAIIQRPAPAKIVHGRSTPNTTIRQLPGVKSKKSRRQTALTH